MIHYLSRTKAADIKGKTALVRLDFNTQDSWRMEAAIPTLKLLIKAGCRIIVASHKGRPAKATPSLSLKKDAGKLSRLLGVHATFVPGFEFIAIREQVAASRPGSIFVLENLRFHPGEEGNDPDFAMSLAHLADFYVNDAFAVSHRANASVTMVPHLMPSYAGLLMEREIAALSGVMKKAAHPLVVVIGGGKAEDKLGVFSYFKNKADYFLTGGAPANTILKIRGVDVKDSLIDSNPADAAFLKAFSKKKTVVVPEDFAVDGRRILDIGPYTIKLYEQILSTARTIIWSGPMGVIEKEKFQAGSVRVARAISKNRTAYTVTGGGETVMFLKKLKLDTRFSFISTGGGAMLEFLEGKKLPGIEALK